MEEKQKTSQRSMDALRNWETGFAGVAAMLMGCLLITLFEHYLIGVLCVTVGSGIITVLLAVEMRQRKP